MSVRRSSWPPFFARRPTEQFRRLGGLRRDDRLQHARVVDSALQLDEGLGRLHEPGRQGPLGRQVRAVFVLGPHDEAASEEAVADGVLVQGVVELVRHARAEQREVRRVDDRAFARSE